MRQRARDLCKLDQKLCFNEALWRNVCLKSESRVLAEHVYIRARPVSERNNIAKCVSESRFLTERVYIRPKSVSQRSIIEKCVCLTAKS